MVKRLIFLLILFSIFTGLNSQNDSLMGFMISEAQKEAKFYNLLDSEYEPFIARKKKEYIQSKYHLNNSYQNNSFIYTASQAATTNLDFETGNLNGWTLFHGSNMNSIEMSDNGFSIGPNFSMVLGSGTDPIVGITLTSPLGGSKVARVNNNVTNYVQSKIRNTINVTANNNLLKFAYAVVLQKTGHQCDQQPYFSVLLRDTVGSILFKFYVEARDTFVNPAACNGYNQTNLISYGPQNQNGAYYSNWSTRCVDLTPYIGKNILIEVIGASCTESGHWGYGYFDAKLESCPEHGKPNNLTVNNQSVDLDQNFIYYFNSNCTSSVTISAPSWPVNYDWNGPPGSGIFSNSQPSFTTSFNGLYTLSMGNNTVCPITKSIYLEASTQPTIISSVTNSNVCINTPFTISLSGAQSYTWNNSVVGPNNIITPTSLGLFTVSAICTSSNGCTVTKTYTFNCNSLPNISITGTPNICSPNNPTLIANGANTYTWLSAWPTGTFTATGATVTGSLPTNSISVTGTDIYGCSSTVVQTIGISTSITLINASLTNTTNLCIGNSAVLYVSGPVNTIPASTYSLAYPSNNYTISGWPTPNVLTPTVSTIYTLSAENYCGIYSQTFAINVQTLVPVINATAITPYCSSNLTVNLSGADTYTINAGPYSTYTISGNTAFISYATNTVIVAGTNTTSMCSDTQTIYPSVITPSYTLIPLSSICGNSVSTFSVTNASSLYSITPLLNYFIPLASTFTANTTFTTIPPVGTAMYKVEAYDTNGCFGTSYLPFGTNSPTISTSINTINSTSYTLCSGQNATVTLSGCNTYTWDNSSNSATLILTPSVSTIYTVQGANACSSTSQTIDITVVPSAITPVTINSPTFTLCKPYCLTFTATGASSYTWQNNATTSTILACASNFTNYIGLKYTDINGCRTTTTITYYGYQPTLAIVGPDTVCSPYYIGYTPIGAGNYTWAIHNSLGTTYSVSTNFTLYPNPNLSTSNWTLTLSGKDANACPGSITKTILVSKAPTIQTNTLITKCPGSADSLIVLNPTISVNSFTWNSSAVGNSISITPSATTIYTVQTKYIHFGCLATKIITVNIFPPTVVSLSLSTNQGCEGVPLPVTLSPTNASIYTNAYYSYQMQYPLSAGIYSIGGFVKDANNCINKSAPQTVTIHPNPNVSFTTSQNNFCQNSGSVSLAGSPGGGVFIGDNVVGNTYVPNNTTTSSVIYKYTDGNGCEGFDHQCIYVNANPSLSVNSGSICPGDSFTIIPTGATSYTYSGGNPVSPSSSTNYTVFGFNSSACSSSIISTVVVYPSPTINVVTNLPQICIGQQATLSASGATSYSWNTGGNASSIVITPSITSNFTVTGIDANGCSSFAVITQSISSCTGELSKNYTESYVSVFPNPNNGKFYIQYTGAEHLTLIIYNSAGQIVLTKEITGGMQLVDSSFLASGMYFYSLTGSVFSGKGKIIIE